MECFGPEDNIFENVPKKAQHRKENLERHVVDKFYNF
jgi:hypothetical protein